MEAMEETKNANQEIDSARDQERDCKETCL